MTDLERRAKEWAKDKLSEYTGWDRMSISMTAEKLIEQAYLAGAAADRWVRVKERLPEMEDLVLLGVSGQQGSVTGGYRIENELDDSNARDWLWEVGEDTEESDAFTHWQPLPEPPKEEK